MHGSPGTRHSRVTRIVAFFGPILLLAVVAALAIGSLPSLALAGTGPSYASPAAREVIEKMVDAHGGMDRFREASAVQFACRFKVHFGGDNWVPFSGKVTADPRTRHVYATLLNPDGTQGRIAYDGRKAWSAGSLQGLGRAPARMTAWRDLYLYALPFMTQDDGVRFGEPKREKMPIGDVDCIAIRMTFDAGAGDTPKDWYVLYVDPATSRLRAAQYVMTYTALMQDGAKSSPPSVFVWEKTATVNGLVVPTQYTVHWAGDRSVAVKEGVIEDWAFDGAFDRSQLVMPADGTPDLSTP
jgi:hypothetical protein